MIAVDGDTVQIKDGSLLVNGEEQVEQYTFEVRGLAVEPLTVGRLATLRPLSSIMIARSICVRVEAG